MSSAPIMDASAILQSFEELTHSERVHQMVEYGRQSKTDPAIANFIHDLSTAPPFSYYEHSLSLHSCYGSRSTTIATKLLLSSTSRHLKTGAINLIVLLGSDEEVLQALQCVPAYLQIRTVRRMRGTGRGRKRLRAVEMFLETVEDSFDNRALFRSLFLLGSRVLVERYLPGLQDSFGKDDWTRLIKYHPDLAETTIREWAAKVEYNDIQLCYVIEAQIPLWISYPGATDSVLELVKFLLSKVPISRFPIPALLSKRPEQTVQLILDCEDDLSEDVVSELGAKFLQDLDMNRFTLLFKRYPLIATTRTFGLLAPAQRLHVYQELGIGWRNEDGVLEMSVVDTLPQEERIDEARRHLALRTFEAEPDRKIAYIALLPWNEAMELQEEFIQNSNANIRSAALREQITAAKWDNAHLVDALQLVLDRKNEQDPVMREMVGALEQIPVGRWKEEHLDALARIIRNTLDSSSTSGSTMRSLLSIVIDLLPNFPTWAKTQLQTITRVRDELPTWYRPTGKSPTRETMRFLAEALAPLLKRLVANNDGTTLWNLAFSFRKQMKHWPELLEVCEQTLKIREMAEWRQNMIDILKEHRPRTWSSIVPGLVAEDSEISGLTVLLNHVHLRQQNLLWDNYIVSQNSWTRQALNTVTGGFWRWTAKQQSGFEKVLLEIIEDKDEEKDDKQKRHAITQLSLLTYLPATPLIGLANDASHPALQETAVRVLGRLDDDRGMPTLIEALSDARARIAVYALRGMLKKNMSKPATLILLKSIPNDKITVRKETIRLIGELETEDAFQHLLEVSRETELHRDVQIALLRSLWLFMDRDETWDIYRTAAKSGEIGIAKAAADLPASQVGSSRIAEVLGLMLLLLGHGEAQVRLYALERCVELKIQDPARVLVPKLLELVYKPPKEAEAAAKAVFAIHGRGTDTSVVEELYGSLVTEQAVLRRVHDDVYLDLVNPEDSDRHTRYATHAILTILAKDRLSVSRRIRTMFSALPWAELKPYLLAIIPQLHPDALVLACEFLAAEKTDAYWSRDEKTQWRRVSDIEDLSDTEARLRHGDEKERRLGLSMLVGTVTARGKGWGVEDREALSGYRDDENPGVAESGWSVVVPELSENEEVEMEQE